MAYPNEQSIELIYVALNDLLGTMSADAQINVKLNQTTLEKWDEYIAEESGFSSRSEFIRYAVSKEVSDRDDDTDGIDEAFAQEVRDGFEELGEQLSDLENQLSTLQHAVREDPEIEELANDLFSALPDEQPGTPAYRQELEARQQQAQHEESEEARREVLEWQATPESLTEAFGSTERKILQALERVQTQTHLVRTDESGEETRYYKDI